MEKWRWRQWNRRIWERESRRKLEMERAEQRIWKGNISRWQARNLELYRQQIVCKSVCSSERVWEGYGRDTLIPIWPLRRGRPRGGGDHMVACRGQAGALDDGSKMMCGK